jgi:hypothetical protein
MSNRTLQEVEGKAKDKDEGNEVDTEVEDEYV